MANRSKLLVLSLQPYKFATRPRKAAAFLSEFADVLFLSPATIGRAGQNDEPGNFMVDGVRVLQLESKRAHTEPSAMNVGRNLVGIYGPTALRLLRQVLSTEADSVFCTSLPLAPLALAHQRKFNSKVVIDVSERPGMATTPGSVASVVAKFDRGLLSWMRSAQPLVTTVTYADTDYLKDECGLQQVQLVRNVPLSDWRAPYRELEPHPGLSLVSVGSIFESRGFEMLIDTMAQCAREGLDVNLDIYGRGRESYLESLQRRIKSTGAENVQLKGSVDRDTVSQTYLNYDLGVVSYDKSSSANDGLSNKLMECVSTGRPVLAADQPENRHFVEKYQVGWLADMTVEAMVSAIRELLDLGSEKIAQTARHCRDLGDAELVWEKEFLPVKEYLVD